MASDVSRTLAGAKAIVTGGASGLGRAVVERIVAQGGRAAILDVNEELGKQAIETLGKQVTYCHTDVTREESVDHAVAEAHRTMGGINLVVNCAGVAPARRVLAKDGLMTTSDFGRVMAVNLIGTFCVCRAGVNVMQNNEPDSAGQRGVIINTASIAAFDGQIGQAAYSASKAGIVGMTLPLAREFARLGIRVLTIAPGLFKTPLFDKLPQKAVEELEKNIPFPHRLGNPAEFALLVDQVFCNTMLNGETIRLDGALRM